MQQAEILSWLREDDPKRIDCLKEKADDVRRIHVGDEIHLRALIEISNYCTNACHYCGLRAANRSIPRYRMDADEIVNTVSRAAEMNFGTVVLQAGNDPRHHATWVADLIGRIKDRFDIAVTLSLGERPFEDYAAWREAGADRYLLRFETSDRTLFEFLHDRNITRGSGVHPRIERLKWLRDLGYEIGGGVMVGLPGQRFEVLAEDISTFHELDLDMIGIGPFIAHPGTPLSVKRANSCTSMQVPSEIEMTLKVVALARLVCPQANIPATTAVEALSGSRERFSFLDGGANVLMPNLTPERYRRLYDIYPGKTSIVEYTLSTHEELLNNLKDIGRCAGKGYGSAKGRAVIRRNSVGGIPKAG